MSKFFKSLKKAKKVDPRPLPEITQEYSNLVNQAGQVQYTIYAMQQDLEQINQKLVAVNHEAAARQKLDKEAQDVVAPTTAEVANNG